MLKLITILKHILLEAKQVGNIYHFTSYGHMSDIAQADFHLKSRDMFKNNWNMKNKENTYISFTRDKTLSAKTTIFTEVRITVDGNKLSNKFNISPYADHEDGYGRNQGQDEMEERIKIDTKKYPNGIDISSYVLAVDVLKPNEDDKRASDGFKDLIMILKDENTKYNVVDKW